MTKENRERLYLHFRDQEHNYDPIPEKNKGLLSASNIKKSSKARADAMLLQHPELEKPQPKPKPKEVMKDGKKE